MLIAGEAHAAGYYGPQSEYSPSVFTYGWRGLAIGGLAGLSLGYIIARDDGFASDDWKPVVYGLGVGALVGGATGLTLGFIDLDDDRPGMGNIALRDMLYGALFGMAAGAIVGALVLIESGSPRLCSALRRQRPRGTWYASSSNHRRPTDRRARASLPGQALGRALLTLTQAAPSRPVAPLSWFHAGSASMKARGKRAIPGTNGATHPLSGIRLDTMRVIAMKGPQPGSTSLHPPTDTAGGADSIPRRLHYDHITRSCDRRNP